MNYTVRIDLSETLRREEGDVRQLPVCCATVNLRLSLGPRYNGHLSVGASDGPFVSILIEIEKTTNNLFFVCWKIWPLIVPQ